MKIMRPGISGGFTLVESLVVLAITAVLLAVGVPSMTSFVADWRLSNAVNAFSGSVQLARIESIKRGKVVRICRSVTGSSCATGGSTAWESGWIVYVDNDASGAGYSNTSDVLLMAQGAMPGVDSIASNQPSLTSFAFNPNGLMSAGMQGFNFNWDAAATRKKALCISRTGRMRSASDNSDCA